MAFCRKVKVISKIRKGKIPISLGEIPISLNKYLQTALRPPKKTFAHCRTKLSLPAGRATCSSSLPLRIPV